MKKEDYICRKCKSHWDLSEAQFVEDDCTGFQVCPFCGSDDIADAVKCPECGEKSWQKKVISKEKSDK